MSIATVIAKMPFWYLFLTIVFSFYYAIRGIMEKSINLRENKYEKWNFFQKMVIEYIQEFLFKVIFTTSGFFALFLANYIFSSLKSVADVGGGTSVVLIFLLIWGISGVSGYLPYLIIRGKFPGVK